MLNTPTLNTLEEVRAFVDGTLCVHLEPTSKAGRYRWLALTLRQFHYRTLSRADKGLLQRYLAKVAGYASAQIKRLVAQWCTTCWRRSAIDPGADAGSDPHASQICLRIQIVLCTSAGSLENRHEQQKWLSYGSAHTFMTHVLE